MPMAPNSKVTDVCDRNPPPDVLPRAAAPRLPGPAAVVLLLDIFSEMFSGCLSNYR